MSYVSSGTLYVTDTVGGGVGAPGAFYGTPFSDVVILSGVIM